MTRRASKTMTDMNTKGRKEERARGRASSLRLFVSSALLALLPLAAAAQPDTTRAQPDPERLPDLTPRAFEIRGDLQISLPNLERQPLRGFAPPPRTYVVPADRRTFVAPYGQPLDGLPGDPLAEPVPPQVSALSPLTGRIDAGFGRYLSRLGRLTVSTGGLGVDVGYSGFSSFQPFGEDGPSDPDFDAVSDVFDGHLAYTTQGPTRLGFSLDGDYQRYSLLGERGLDTPVPPNRTGRTLGGGVFVTSDQPERVGYDLGARFASTDYAVSVADDLLDAGVPPGSFEQTEARLEADGGVRYDRFRLDAGGAFAGLGDEGLGESLTAYHAGGTVRLDVGRGELEVGARLLGYEASAANGGGSSLNVGPVVRFAMPLAASARLFVRAEPRAEGGSLAALYRENPFAVPQPFVLPSLHVLDGTGGVEIQSEAVRITAYGGATYSPVYRYYERAASGLTEGLYAVRYGEATVVRAGGSLTVYAPNGLRATLGAEARSASLDGGADVPYVAPLTGSLSLGLPFAGARGLVQVTGSAESARPTEDPDRDAAAWATLDAEATYRFAAGFGVLLRAERLAGRAEQWPGNPRPPGTVLAGLRVQW